MYSRLLPEKPPSVRSARVKFNMQWHLYLLILTTAVCVFILTFLGFRRPLHLLELSPVAETVPPEILQEEPYPPLAENETFLVVYIYSSPMSREARQRIRDTWATPELKRYFNMTVIFVIGDVPRWLEAKYKNESATYGDMIRFPVKESYKNLPKKAKHILNWIHVNYPSVRYIMKTDEDVMVNIFEVVDYYRYKITPNDTRFHCMIIDDFKPERNRKASWYIKKEEFAGSVFPPYCVGHGVLFTRPVLEKLVDGYAKTNSTLWIEDAVSYGIVRSEVGIDIVDIRRRYVDGFAPEMLYSKVLWFAHLFRPQWKAAWRKMWNTLLLQYTDLQYVANNTNATYLVRVGSEF